MVRLLKLAYIRLVLCPAIVVLSHLTHNGALVKRFMLRASPDPRIRERLRMHFRQEIIDYQSGTPRPPRSAHKSRRRKV